MYSMRKQFCFITSILEAMTPDSEVHEIIGLPSLLNDARASDLTVPRSILGMALVRLAVHHWVEERDTDWERVVSIEDSKDGGLSFALLKADSVSLSEAAYDMVFETSVALGKIRSLARGC